MSTVQKLQSLASFKPAMSVALKLRDVEGVPLQVNGVDLKESTLYGPFMISHVTMLQTGESQDLLISSKLPREALQAVIDKEAFPVTCIFAKHGKYWDVLPVEETVNPEVAKGEDIPF